MVQQCAQAGGGSLVQRVEGRLPPGIGRKNQMRRDDAIEVRLEVAALERGGWRGRARSVGLLHNLIE